MGKRKSKGTESTLVNDAVPAASSILKSLFPDIPAEDTAVSTLFSDENPFRRKPQQQAVSVVDAEVVELDKRKKKKGKQNDVDSNSVAGDTKDIAKNPNLVEVLEDGDNPTSKRRKRKRDEVEKEYEEKKYGANMEDEEKKKLVGVKRKKSDDAADTMVIKEGFDDESKLLRTVFLGNLPIKLKKKVLLKEFSKFGEIDSIRIRSVPIADTKKSRKGAIMQNQINENASSVHAYVVFKTEQSAEAALANNMTMIAGNHVRVDRACPPRKKLKGENTALYDPKRTVFVGNLPFDVKDEELYQLICGFKNLESGIEAVRVIRDPHVNLGKGIAYVLFKTREVANMLIRKGNLKLRDRELRLSFAKTDATPSKKRKNTSDSNSPAKKLAVDTKKTSATKADLSYQGLHATKSGSTRKTRVVQVKSTEKGKREEKPKDRMQKRPTVAARKAKATALKSGVDQKAVGFKRKMNNRTPESSGQKKRVKK